MQLFHDSRDPLYRSPGGAQPCGTPVTLALRVQGETPDSVRLRLWVDKESFLPMHAQTDDAALYTATLTLPQTPCILWYDFQVLRDGQFYWYGNAEDSLGGIGAMMWGEARSYLITVYDAAFKAPEWTRGTVFYQIFPDRFARGKDGARLPMDAERYYHERWDEPPALVVNTETGDNIAHDFFGGTLRGIRENLPYIASLGVTALYLNPIFSASTNHRFDTNDWKTIDPALGTEADFHALCEDALAMDIRVVLDGVFSHSGKDNPMFRHAQSHPDSPYRDWYRFERWPDTYKSWWGFATLPDLNKHQPEVIDYFLTGEDAIVKKWLRAGAGGWRIDVADELPMDYLREMRQSVKSTNADGIIIGEVWEDASRKMSYGEMRSYCLGDTLDGVMNYPLREAAIGFLTGALNASAFKREMDALYENYPTPFAMALLNVLGSHDRARILNVLSGADGGDRPWAERVSFSLTKKQRQLGAKRLMLLLTLIVTMPGNPCVYYGDEAGMEGCADPFSRGTFPWGREDKPLTAFFATMLRRRRQVAALSAGVLQMDAPCADVLCVSRHGEDSIAYTVINRGSRSRKVTYGSRTVSVAAYGYEIWEE